MVGTGRGAELGILFRKGEALQSLRDAKVVAVDKTGTLTEGHPALTDLHLTPGFDRAEVLGRIAAVEDKSEHPIARAIVAAARAEGITLPAVRDFESVTGFGVKADVARLTLTARTPSTFSSARSTRPTQDAQFMPAIGRVIAISAGLSRIFAAVIARCLW